MAESVVEFLTISVALGADFVWNVDQAVVTLTSAKWKGEKRVVFQKGAKDAMDIKVIKLRSDCCRECVGEFEADTAEAREAFAAPTANNNSSAIGSGVSAATVTACLVRPAIPAIPASIRPIAGPTFSSATTTSTSWKANRSRQRE